MACAVVADIVVPVVLACVVVVIVVVVDFVVRAVVGIVVAGDGIDIDVGILFAVVVEAKAGVIVLAGVPFSEKYIRSKYNISNTGRK